MNLVRNLDNFDPVAVNRRHQERKRVFQRIEECNNIAAVTAAEAVKDVNLAIKSAEIELEELIRRAKAANRYAVKIAYDAQVASFKVHAEAMEVIAVEIERIAREKAAKAAFDASVIAWKAAFDAQKIHVALEPVLEYVEIEKAKILMEDIQNRVVELMHVDNSGVDCSLIAINLIKYEIKLLEQIQFAPGTADILPLSDNLLGQLVCAKKCISQVR